MQLKQILFQFLIAGPSTDTRTTHFTSFGIPVGEGTPFRRAQTQVGNIDLILINIIEFFFLCVKHANILCANFIRVHSARNSFPNDFEIDN